MIVYHFTIHATECSERMERYFSRKKDAVAACKTEAAILAKSDPSYAGDTIAVRRSELVRLPKEDLILRCLNHRAFLTSSVDTVDVASIKVPSP